MYVYKYLYCIYLFAYIFMYKLLSFEPRAGGRSLHVTSTAEITSLGRLRLA